MAEQNVANKIYRRQLARVIRSMKTLNKCQLNTEQTIQLVLMEMRLMSLLPRLEAKFHQELVNKTKYEYRKTLNMRLRALAKMMEIRANLRHKK